MKEEYHFWYSGKQREVLRKHTLNRALIRGEEVEYTECNKKNDPAGLWDDYRYLGRGTIYKVNGFIQ